MGPEKAMELTEQCLPISVHEARAIRLIDDVILDDNLGESPFCRFRDQIIRIAENSPGAPGTALGSPKSKRRGSRTNVASPCSIIEWKNCRR